MTRNRPTDQSTVSESRQCHSWLYNNDISQSEPPIRRISVICKNADTFPYSGPVYLSIATVLPLYSSLLHFGVFLVCAVLSMLPLCQYQCAISARSLVSNVRYYTFLVVGILIACRARRVYASRVRKSGKLSLKTGQDSQGTARELFDGGYL